MRQNPIKKDRPAGAVSAVRLKVKRLWRKTGLWREEDYPDWMMYIPNPPPLSDEPEQRP